MNHNHLSTAEVAIFRSDRDSSRSIEIGRHLLTCTECRAKLPTGSPQQLRDLILGSDGTSLIAPGRSSRVFDLPRLSTWSVARATAFAGLVILLGIGLYFAAGDKLAPTDTPIATFGDDPIGTSFDSIPTEGIAAAPSFTEQNDPILKGPVRRGAEATPSALKNGQGKTKKPEVVVQVIRNAETRGNENPCSSGAIINLESESDGNEIVLKWNAVKGAASYDVYIADLDENLIDHFESKSQTHYRSNVILEPAKSYRWKLIITLKSGNRIVAPPQALKARATPANSAKSGSMEKKRASFAVRCIASK